MKRKTRTTVEYVTRDMLADLRDEIEEVLDKSNATLMRVEKELQRRDRILSAFHKAESRVEAMEKTVRDVKGLLGIERIPPYSPALHEPVSWSYFHVWIARINERLEQLEKKMSAPHG